MPAVCLISLTRLCGEKSIPSAAGSVAYTDLHLSQVADRARRGFLGGVDVCVVEACVIREDGGLIPTTAVGNAPCFITESRQVIVELNLAQPAELEGLHDIYRPDGALIPIDSAAVHIGKAFMPCPPEKIAAIVVTNRPDDLQDLAPTDAVSQAMAGHICGLLKSEMDAGKLPRRLTLQAGVGNVANAVLEGLLNFDMEPLEFYSEVIQDSALNLLDAGKMQALSGTALALSHGAMTRFISNLTDYRRSVVLRPQEISNNPAVIARLGLVAINTALEVDIYGNVNSTHVLGTGYDERDRRFGGFCPQRGPDNFYRALHCKGRNHFQCCPDGFPYRSYRARCGHHCHRAGLGGPAGQRPQGAGH